MFAAPVVTLGTGVAAARDCFGQTVPEAGGFAGLTPARAWAAFEVLGLKLRGTSLPFNMLPCLGAGFPQSVGLGFPFVSGRQ